MSKRLHNDVAPRRAERGEHTTFMSMFMFRGQGGELAIGTSRVLRATAFGSAQLGSAPYLSSLSMLRDKALVEMSSGSGSESNGVELTPSSLRPGLATRNPKAGVRGEGGGRGQGGLAKPS